MGIELLLALVGCSVGVSGLLIKVLEKVNAIGRAIDHTSYQVDHLTKQLDESVLVDRLLEKKVAHIERFLSKTGDFQPRD